VSRQDYVTGRILEEFSDGSRPPAIKDRRDQPSHGYRAVHVIVFVGGVLARRRIAAVNEADRPQVAAALDKALERTHSRYFKNLGQLAASARENSSCRRYAELSTSGESESAPGAWRARNAAVPPGLTGH
jgi:hypothetical protein